MDEPGPPLDSMRNSRITVVVEVDENLGAELEFDHISALRPILKLPPQWQNTGHTLEQIIANPIFQMYVGELNFSENIHHALWFRILSLMVGADSIGEVRGQADLDAINRMVGSENHPIRSGDVPEDPYLREHIGSELGTDNLELLKHARGWDELSVTDMKAALGCSIPDTAILAPISSCGYTINKTVGSTAILILEAKLGDVAKDAGAFARALSQNRLQMDKASLHRRCWFGITTMGRNYTRITTDAEGHAIIDIHCELAAALVEAYRVSNPNSPHRDATSFTVITESKLFRTMDTFPSIMVQPFMPLQARESLWGVEALVHTALRHAHGTIISGTSGDPPSLPSLGDGFVRLKVVGPYPVPRAKPRGRSSASVTIASSHFGGTPSLLPDSSSSESRIIPQPTDPVAEASANKRRRLDDSYEDAPYCQPWGGIDQPDLMRDMVMAKAANAGIPPWYAGSPPRNAVLSPHVLHGACAVPDPDCPPTLLIPRTLQPKRKKSTAPSSRIAQEAIADHLPGQAALESLVKTTGASEAGKSPELNHQDQVALATYLGTLLSDWSIEMKDGLSQAMTRVVDPTDISGFVPLQSLMSSSPEPLLHSVPQNALVPLLRRSNIGIEVRIALTEPTSVGSTRAKGEPGYEVRRTGGSPQSLLAAGHSDDEERQRHWFDRTIFIEGIPKSTPTRIDLIRDLQQAYPSLLPSSSDPKAGSIQAVLSIEELIARDVEMGLEGGKTTTGSARRNAGAAELDQCFVVFRDVGMALRLLRDLPWDGKAEGRAKEEAEEMVCDDGDAAPVRTMKSDSLMRAISRRRFADLQAEYQSQQRQLHLRTEASARPPVPQVGSRKETRSTDQIHREASSDALAAAAHIGHDPSSAGAAVANGLPYPAGCVLFVRNVPVDTNKTALKVLFNELADKGDAVSYVEWDKGMDSAHLRIVNAALASRIKINVESRTDVEMRVELLSGRPEELYWSALPEQIRARALQASRGEMVQHGSGGGAGRKRKW